MRPRGKEITITGNKTCPLGNPEKEWPNNKIEEKGPNILPCEREKIGREFGKKDAKMALVPKTRTQGLQKPIGKKIPWKMVKGVKNGQEFTLTQFPPGNKKVYKWGPKKGLGGSS